MRGISQLSSGSLADTGARAHLGCGKHPRRRTAAVAAIATLSVLGLGGVVARGVTPTPAPPCVPVVATHVQPPGGTSRYPTEGSTPLMTHDGGLDITGYSLTGVDDGAGGGIATARFDLAGAPVPPAGYGGAFYDVDWKAHGVDGNG